MMMPNRSQAFFAMIAAVFSGVAFGQVNPDVPIKVLTVCEVLSDPQRYDGSQIAVVGRFDKGGMIDGCCALVEDRCEKPVVTKGYVWENRIDVPILDAAKRIIDIPIDEVQLNEKLDLVRKSSELHCAEWPVFLPSREVKMKNFRDQWAVAYGRIEFRIGLEPPTGTKGTASFRWGNGFGHLGRAPALIWITTAKTRFIGSTDCEK